MSAIIMDGKALAQRIKVDIAAAIGKLDKPVGLGTILVGNDPGSVAYVEGKHRDCAGLSRRRAPATRERPQCDQAARRASPRPRLD